MRLVKKNVIGIALISGKVYFFQKIIKAKNSQIIALLLKNEGEFLKTKKTFQLSKTPETGVSLDQISYISVSKAKVGFIGVIGFGIDFYSASSSDGFSWKIE